MWMLPLYLHVNKKSDYDMMIKKCILFALEPELHVQKKAEG